MSQKEFGVIFTVSISDLRINAVDCIMICESGVFLMQMKYKPNLSKQMVY